MWDCQIIMPHITMINAYEFCFLLFGWHVLLAI
jgi:hypothetical protein